jgi:HK97 family phage major capsid protein
VQGDTGLKQTTEANWSNKYLNVEEIAAIVPIPENVLDDTSFDVWASIIPLIRNAIGRTLDAAIFFNVNKPASWPTSIAAGAVSAGNTVARGANDAAHGGLAGDISDLEGKVEASGFDVNGFVADRVYRGRLRQIRSTQGERLMDVDIAASRIDGEVLKYAMPGLWPTGTGAAELFAGDFTQGILGIRKDITMKLLTEAVIQDNTGAIVYNLAQQDMVAMRFTARFAFQIANTINYSQQVEANRYPFGIVTTP